MDIYITFEYSAIFLVIEANDRISMFSDDRRVCYALGLTVALFADVGWKCHLGVKIMASNGPWLSLAISKDMGVLDELLCLTMDCVCCGPMESYSLSLCFIDGFCTDQ